MLSHSCLAPFLTPDLTVFYSVVNWMKHIRLLAVAIILMLILGYHNGVFPDTAMGSAACKEVLHFLQCDCQ